MTMNIMWLFLWLMMIIIDDDGRCWYKLDGHNDNAFIYYDGCDCNGDDEPCWQYMSSSMYVCIYVCMYGCILYVCMYVYNVFIFVLYVCKIICMYPGKFVCLSMYWCMIVCLYV